MRIMRAAGLSFLVLGLVAAATGASVESAHAQCAFDEPTRNGVAYSGRFFSTLVQAYVGCGVVGGNTPNTTTIGALPACSPPETGNQQAGSPTNGWRFSQVPNQSYGRVLIQRLNGVFTNPAGVRDTQIRIELKKIIDFFGPANSTGTLQIILRATTNDPTGGDMTVIDYPVQLQVPLVSGNATIITSLATILASTVGPRFPDCTSHEILSVEVYDPNFILFAVPGVRVN